MHGAHFIFIGTFSIASPLDSLALPFQLASRSHKTFFPQFFYYPPSTWVAERMTFWSIKFQSTLNWNHLHSEIRAKSRIGRGGKKLNYLPGKTFSKRNIESNWLCAKRKHSWALQPPPRLAYWQRRMLSALGLHSLETWHVGRKRSGRHAMVSTFLFF